MVNMKDEEKYVELKKHLHIVMNDIPTLQTNNDRLRDNVNDDNFENIIDEMKSNIIKLQNEVEMIYFDVNKELNSKDN